jgi:hypothetical protein
MSITAFTITTHYHCAERSVLIAVALKVITLKVAMLNVVMPNFRVSWRRSDKWCLTKRRVAKNTVV